MVVPGVVDDVVVVGWEVVVVDDEVVVVGRVVDVVDDEVVVVGRLVDVVDDGGVLVVVLAGAVVDVDDVEVVDAVLELRVAKKTTPTPSATITTTRVAMSPVLLRCGG